MSKWTPEVGNKEGKAVEGKATGAGQSRDQEAKLLAREGFCKPHRLFPPGNDFIHKKSQRNLLCEQISSSALQGTAGTDHNKGLVLQGST